MERIKILLVDDDGESRGLFQQELEVEFERLGIPVDFGNSRSASTALRKLKNTADRHESIDVAFIDLCLTADSADPDGVRVLRDMAEYHKDAYVLLYTGLDRENPGFTHEYQDLANLVIRKWDIRENSKWSWRSIAEDIKVHLTNVGRLNAGPTTYNEEDVGIMSVLEEVGHDAPLSERHEVGARILRLLALQCLDGLVNRGRDLEIEFLASGRSGANVCRLVFSGASEPRQSFVLKFSFDQGALKRELEKNRDAVGVLGQSPLMAIVGKLGSHKSGYHAITANFVANASNNAMPLRKWLTDMATAEQATRMAKEVLAELLEPLFHPNGFPRVSVDDWITLRSGKRLRTLAAIERYGSALSDSRAGDLPDSVELMGRLSAFVHGSREIAGAPSVLADVVQVRSFGDLHSNNILVQLGVNPRPVLIDASLYGQDHWSADHVRLLVDLLLRVRNSGVESMLWPPVTDADEQVVLLCRQCQSPESLEEPRGGATDAFIAQAVRQLTSSTHRDALGIPSTAWHWEWHVALARELLRQATYEDLTPPRACMGLVLADRHLRIASGLPR